MDLADFEQSNKEDIYIDFFENTMHIMNWRELSEKVCEEIIRLNQNKYSDVIMRLSEGVVIND